MILFEKVRWKNFLSTGNQFTEIDFLKYSTNLIIGTNGAGKSTVLDALTFSLFGKSFRKINKPQLINSVNEKDCVVEVEFSINGTQWKIQRGIKPAIFKIWRDDNLLDQSAAANDQQKWLEQNVLKMNYKSFTQIVILGSSTFVPFMQLTPGNRREVIEDLLDIRIFSSMNTVIKEKIRSVKESVKVLELKKESLIEKVQMQENFIDELENRGKKNIADKELKIQGLLNEENDLMNACEGMNEELNSLEKNLEKHSGATEKLRTLGNLKGKISTKVSSITKEHKFFTQNTVCPTCNQDIEETFRINRINDAQTKAKELQSGYKELEEAIKKEEERERQFLLLSKEITSLTHGISKNNTQISGCQRQVRDLESEIQRITDNLANRNIEHEKLTTFKDNLKTTYDELAQHKDTINYYDFSYSLLKDGGVKTKIIKKYLPLINQQVNRYLQLMDFYINFSLDEEFNETVQSPIHEDFSYSSFSEGEKMRIDLALLFTWREVARMKNSVNTNLLIMDEVFDSSLDGVGTEDFLKIIRFIIKDANVFVISHKESLHDKFEDVKRFDKIKGFSRIVS
jgi:DNA repair exonuclease SbcCD ATPase subunit